MSEVAARMLQNFAKIMASMMEARPEGFAGGTEGAQPYQNPTGRRPQPVGAEPEIAKLRRFKNASA